MSIRDSITALLTFENGPELEGPLDDGTAQGRLDTISISASRACNILVAHEGADNSLFTPATQAEVDQKFDEITDNFYTTEAAEPEVPEKAIATTDNDQSLPYDQQTFLAKAQADLQQALESANQPEVRQ